MEQLFLAVHWRDRRTNKCVLATFFWLNTILVYLLLRLLLVPLLLLCLHVNWDSLVQHGWRLSSRTWNPITSPDVAPNRDWLLRLALHTLSGAYNKWMMMMTITDDNWWWYWCCVRSCGACMRSWWSRSRRFSLVSRLATRRLDDFAARWSAWFMSAELASEWYFCEGN